MGDTSHSASRSPSPMMERDEHDRSSSPGPQYADPQPPRNRRNNRRRGVQQPQQLYQQQMQQDQQPLPEQNQALAPLGQPGVSNAAGQAGQLLSNTLGQVTGQAAGDAPATGGKSNTLKLRLDLNLDVEVQIKARVHGDVTLSLLQ